MGMGKLGDRWGPGGASGLVLYHVLLDRFQRGRGRELDFANECKRHPPAWCGGDLAGVIERLPHIQDLGCNGLWLSPVTSNERSAYHGYHVTDCFEVDSHFGTMDDFRELARRCKDAGILFVMDFVPNHISREHPLFVAAISDPTCEHRSWFLWRDEAPGYVPFLTFDCLVKLNLDDPGARAYVIRAAKFWLDLGVDGLRLDHCIGPSHSFWREFVREVRHCHPQALLFGEAWLEPQWGPTELATLGIPSLDRIWRLSRCFARLPGLSFLAFDVGMRPYVDLFDGAIDFAFQSIISDFAKASQIWPLWMRSCLLRMQLWLHEFMFPKDFGLVRFLDNHDMERFMFRCGDNPSTFLEAATEMFSLSRRHPISLYYGTEVGMTQSQSFADFAGMEGYGDLMARACFRWEVVAGHPLLPVFRALVREKTIRG